MNISCTCSLSTQSLSNIYQCNNPPTSYKNVTVTRESYGQFRLLIQNDWFPDTIAISSTLSSVLCCDSTLSTVRWSSVSHSNLQLEQNAKWWTHICYGMPSASHGSNESPTSICQVIFPHWTKWCKKDGTISQVTVHLQKTNVSMTCFSGCRLVARGAEAQPLSYINSLCPATDQTGKSWRDTLATA